MATAVIRASTNAASIQKAALEFLDAPNPIWIGYADSGLQYGYEFVDENGNKIDTLTIDKYVNRVQDSKREMASKLIGN